MHHASGTALRGVASGPAAPILKRTKLAEAPSLQPVVVHRASHVTCNSSKSSLGWGTQGQAQQGLLRQQAPREPLPVAAAGAREPAPLSTTVETTANVRFRLKYRTSFGQAVKILGSHERLGNWTLEKAAEMRWTSGDIWVADVKLPAGGVYEYKYVLIDFETKEAIEWQSGSNAVLAVVVSETDVDVLDNWGNNPGSMVKVDNEQMTRESKLLKWSTEMMGYWKEARRLQIEVAQRQQEVAGVKNELAALRMELSMERQGRMQAEGRVMELQVDNAQLKSQLTQKTVELNNTLNEVLTLLDKELAAEDGGEAEEEYEEEYEEVEEDDQHGYDEDQQQYAQQLLAQQQQYAQANVVSGRRSPSPRSYGDANSPARRARAANTANMVGARAGGR